MNDVGHVQYKVLVIVHKCIIIIIIIIICVCELT